MTSLLDSHTFLWYLWDDPHLSDAARAIIDHEESRCYVSIASIWEIAIKVSSGKLALSEPFAQYIPKQLALNRFDILPIQVVHTAHLVGMTYHHRDPFDRLIIAQALVENIPILSVDTLFDDYGVQRIW